MADVVREVGTSKIEDQDYGVFEKEGRFCNQKWMYTTEMKGAYYEPKFDFGHNEEIFIKLKIKELFVETLGSYQSVWTLCHAAAGQVNAIIKNVDIDLTLFISEDEEGVTKYTPEFHEMKVGEIDIYNPNAPKWVEQWMLNYINQNMPTLLQTDMSAKIKGTILRKIIEIIEQ